MKRFFKLFINVNIGKLTIINGIKLNRYQRLSTLSGGRSGGRSMRS